MSYKTKPRRFPFSTSISEDVQEALARHHRKTGEKVVDVVDRSLRAALGMGKTNDR